MRLASRGTPTNASRWVELTPGTATCFASLPSFTVTFETCCHNGERMAEFGHVLDIHPAWHMPPGEGVQGIYADAESA